MITTNGYLVQLIRAARDAPEHPSHVPATKFFNSYRKLEEHFHDRVHPFVDAGLFGDSVRRALDSQEPPDIMTVHGCRHISDLIESLDKIAERIPEKRGARELSVEEAYLLLCAAHVHDAGNIGGRAKHPQRSGKLVAAHRDLFYDTEACENVYDIARVHGGTSDRFGKDTLREINRDNFEHPRLHLLASILRIGDELSENPERVPNELLTWFTASPQSNLAYRYAQAFREFETRNDTLSIRLRLYPEQHQYTANVEGTTITFFDHLQRKIDVIEREARYCSLYGRPDFDIRHIRISIEYYDAPWPEPVTNTVTLALDLGHGYPTTLDPLAERCIDMGGAASFADYIRGVT